MTDQQITPGMVDYASRALQAALDGNLQAGMAEVVAMSRALGSDTIPEALMAWIDTLGHTAADSVGVPLAEITAHLDGLVFQDGVDGPLEMNADNVPPAPRWAGRLIHARLRMDRDTWTALMAAIPEDPRQVGHHVAHVLEAVSTTIRQLHAGHPVLFIGHAHPPAHTPN